MVIHHCNDMFENLLLRNLDHMKIKLYYFFPNRGIRNHIFIHLLVLCILIKFYKLSFSLYYQKKNSLWNKIVFVVKLLRLLLKYFCAFFYYFFFFFFYPYENSFTFFKLYF